MAEDELNPPRVDGDLASFPRGVKLLHDPVRNKGTAFSEQERDALGLRGLLPPRVFDQNEQVSRVLENLHRKADDLERYIYLLSLQDRNELLFYRVVIDHLEDMLPLIYTPTVGKACQEYGHIFRRPRGLFITAEDRGRVEEILRNWPHADARIVVATDGERILGLGDLGADGMGIPIGKLALYTACAGVSPTQCLPITIDVGTDNEELLADPLYIGLPRRRLRGHRYDELIEEVVQGLARVFPGSLLQFEDFGNVNAFRLLDRYRERICCFNDDVQGTGSVALAGFYSAARVTGQPIRDSRVLFVGAGEAGIGMSRALVAALVAEGMSEEEAHQRCWLFDSRGLVTSARASLPDHKREFAHDHEPLAELDRAVEALKPSAIVGACGVEGRFTPAVLETMARVNERPIVFALSNPTSKAECTAAQAYESTGGRCVFASGSPFAPVEHGGRSFVPGQGNNAYIFPGLGLGALFSRASKITDEMFLVAARTLADQVTEADLSAGRLYPPLASLRSVSAAIAESVAGVAFDRGLAGRSRPPDLTEAISAFMFWPRYPSYV